MAVRIAVVLALLAAFAYGFAKLVERYGGAGNDPASPCGKVPSVDCPDPNAPPPFPKPDRTEPQRQSGASSLKAYL